MQLSTLLDETDLPARTPRHLGRCKARLRAGLAATLVAGTLASAMSGCGKGSGGATVADARAQPPPAGGAPATPNGAPAQPPIPVAVQPVATGEIASYYKATATLEAEKQAAVLARVSGLVRSLACEEGDLVREGGVLLQIDNEEYRLRLDQAQARAANLSARFARLSQMREQQLASDEEFQTAKSELEAAEAEAGLARLSLSYTTVTAPFGGRVVRRLVNVGQTVANSTALFELADFEPLLARVHVPSKEFKKLQPDQPVELVLDSGMQRLQGRIKLVSPVIDPSSGTIKVTVELDGYPSSVRPGDFAEVQIVTERHLEATLVPRLAVISEKGEDVVYVSVGGVAERRVVTLGFTDNDHAELLSGVEPGESVVVKGQRSLKHGSPIKILEAGPGEIAQDKAS